MVLSLLCETEHFISWVESQNSNWCVAWLREWILMKPTGKWYKDLLIHSCSLQVTSNFTASYNCISSCKLNLDSCLFPCCRKYNKLYCLAANTSCTSLKWDGLTVCSFRTLRLGIKLIQVYKLPERYMFPLNVDSYRTTEEPLWDIIMYCMMSSAPKIHVEACGCPTTSTWECDCAWT